MATIPRSQNHLAAMLGIAKSAMSAQAKRGCPTNTLEAAQAWRAANLDPGRRKGSRFDQYYQEPRRQQRQPARASASEHTLAEQASALLAAASALLETHQSIEALMPSLRAALRAVPEPERDDVALSLDVIKVLARDVLALLPRQGSGALNSDGSPVWCDGATMPEGVAQECGEFWYSCAAGELVAT